MANRVNAIMAAQAFLDDERTGGMRRGKFAVLLAPNVDHQSIESMTIEGPNGYRFEIAAQEPFQPMDGNGYVVDRDTRRQWFMAYEKNGFIQDGEYRFEVRFHDGVVERRARTLRYDDVVLSAYLRDRPAMRWTPVGTARPDDEGRLEFSWTTLAERSGPDAYYSLRVWERPVSADTPARHAYFDNLFLWSAARPHYALNKSSARIRLDEDCSRYAWFVEIMDSNRFEDVNLVIFTPWQTFEPENARSHQAAIEA